MVAVPKDIADRIRLVQEPGMNAVDWMVLGKTECKINVPLVSRYDLRVVADQLRALATACDFESRRTDIPERTSLMRIRAEVDGTNRVIRTHYESVYERVGIPLPKKGGRPKAIEEIQTGKT
jgi:hypothetical protein